jgi:hypothetical protein
MKKHNSVLSTYMDCWLRQQIPPACIESDTLQKVVAEQYKYKLGWNCGSAEDYQSDGTNVQPSSFLTNTTKITQEAGVRQHFLRVIVYQKQIRKNPRAIKFMYRIDPTSRNKMYQTQYLIKHPTRNKNLSIKSRK